MNMSVNREHAYAEMCVNCGLPMGNHYTGNPHGHCPSSLRGGYDSCRPGYFFVGSGVVDETYPYGPEEQVLAAYREIPVMPPGREVPPTRPPIIGEVNVSRDPSMDSMNELCCNCSLPRGQHYGGSCPTAVDCGVMTVRDGYEFVGSEQYRSCSDFPSGTRAVFRDVPVSVMPEDPMMRVPGMPVPEPTPVITEATIAASTVEAVDPNGWFAFAGNEEDLHLLNELGVCASLAYITRPAPMTCVVFPESDIGKVAERFRFIGGRLETDMFGTRFLERFVRMSVSGSSEGAGPEVRSRPPIFGSGESMAEILSRRGVGPMPMDPADDPDQPITLQRLARAMRGGGPVIEPISWDPQEPITTAGVTTAEGEPIRVIIAPTPVIPAAETAAPAAEAGTPEEFVRYRVFKENPSNLDAWEAIQPVVDLYSQLVGRHISVCCPHGCGSETAKIMLTDFNTQLAKEKFVLDSKKWLRVLLWAVPTYTEHPTETTFDTVFGLRLRDGQHDGQRMKKVENGTLIFSGEVPVAQVVVQPDGAHWLYVAFDLAHMNENAAQLMEGILDRYMEVMGIVGADGGEAKKLYTLALHMSSMWESVKTLHQQKVAELNSNVRDYGRTLQSKVRELFQETQIVEALNNAKDRTKHDKEQIEMLFKLPHVVDVRKEANRTLCILTDRIDFNCRGEKFLGHKYKILLRPDTGVIQILANDMLPLRRSHVHPHVNAEGIPCLGNIAAGVAKYLTEMEFAPLVQLLIQYLGMTNEGDWYYSPLNWPRLGSPDANILLGLNADGTPRAGAAPVEEEEDEPEDEPENEEWTCPNCGHIWPSREDAEPCSNCGDCVDCCDGEQCMNHDYDDADDSGEGGDT